MSQKTILYATDFSRASAAALTVAETLARDGNAKLLIVHVSQSESAPIGELFEEEPGPRPEELTRLEAVRPMDQEIPFEHRLVFAEPDAVDTPPATQLLRLADDEQVAMIVVGTQGREGLSRLFSGSVAETLIERAACPVVTVRQPFV